MFSPTQDQSLSLVLRSCSWEVAGGYELTEHLDADNVVYRIIVNASWIKILKKPGDIEVAHAILRGDDNRPTIVFQRNACLFKIYLEEKTKESDRYNLIFPNPGFLHLTGDWQVH